MKKCQVCKKEKEESCFGRNKSRKDQLQTSCKICDNSRSTAYHHKNKENLLPKIYARKLKRIIRNKEYINNYFSTHHCIDCDEKDVRVLDFDHVRGVKEAGISRMATDGVNLQKIILEIEKCEVRCANCHRKKTHTERGYHSYLALDSSVAER